MMDNFSYNKYNLACILLRKGEFEESIKAFQEVIQIEPSFVPAHHNLGISYYSLGLLEEAKKEYEIVLQLEDIDPDMDSLNNLGIILAELGQLEEAKKVFYQALKADPNYSLTYFNLVAYYKKIGDFRSMVEFKNEAERINAKIFLEEPNSLKIKVEKDNSFYFDDED